MQRSFGIQKLAHRVGLSDLTLCLVRIIVNVMFCFRCAAVFLPPAGTRSVYVRVTGNPSYALSKLNAKVQQEGLERMLKARKVSCSRLAGALPPPLPMCTGALLLDLGAPHVFQGKAAVFLFPSVHALPPSPASIRHAFHPFFCCRTSPSPPCCASAMPLMLSTARSSRSE